MTKPYAQDQIVSYGHSPAWLMRQPPVEVRACTALTAESNNSPTADADIPHGSAPVPQSVPTRDQMMAAFRALREQRRHADEPDLVVDEIINAEAPGSLMADIHNIPERLDK